VKSKRKEDDVNAPRRKIRIIVADDEPLARAGIRALLMHAEDLEVVGEAQDGFEAQRMVEELEPNILLLDYKMPGPRPAELERWVRENHPRTATLILTAHHHESRLAEMMAAGVAGYLTKGISETALIDSIRLAAQGGIHFDKEQFQQAEKWTAEVGKKWESLSKREREVLKLLAIGAGNPYITSTLKISTRTAEGHIRSVLVKLKVDTRHQAAAWMLTNLPDEVG
jgi:two-component system, NarL family, response regulator NreC